jgi:hypothetical protein
VKDGAKTLLDGADGAVDFTNVSVGSNESEMNIGEIVLDTLKLGVAVYVSDSETLGSVEGTNC